MNIDLIEFDLYVSCVWFFLPSFSKFTSTAINQLYVSMCLSVSMHCVQTGPFFIQDYVVKILDFLLVELTCGCVQHDFQQATHGRLVIRLLDLNQ